MSRAGQTTYPVKKWWPTDISKLLKKLLNVGHQAKLLYLPMSQCIFGQIEVLSRYSTNLTTIKVVGVVLTTDYENRFEILKTFESRGLNEELSIFEAGDRHWGLFFNDLETSVGHHFFTGYVVWPVLFTNYTEIAQSSWRDTFFGTLL